MKRLCIAAICLAALAVPASSFANGEDDNACDLVKGSATFKQALGGGRVQFTRNLTAHSGKQNPSGVLHSVCNGYIWSGAKPSSRQAALAALRSGKASLFSIETWEPDDNSPHADNWLAHDFPVLIKNKVGVGTLPGLPAQSRFRVRAFAPRAKPCSWRSAQEPDGRSKRS